MSNDNRRSGSTIGDRVRNNPSKLDPYKLITTAILVKFKVTQAMAEEYVNKGIREERPTIDQLDQKTIKHAEESFKHTGGRQRIDSTGHRQYDAGKRFSRKDKNAVGLIQGLALIGFELQDAHLFQKNGEEVFTLNLNFEKKEKNPKIDPSMFEKALAHPSAEVHVWHNPDSKVTVNFVAKSPRPVTPISFWDQNGTVFLR